jgi:hypothetical protein
VAKEVLAGARDGVGENPQAREDPCTCRLLRGFIEEGGQQIAELAMGGDG